MESKSSVWKINISAVQRFSDNRRLSRLTRWPRGGGTVNFPSLQPAAGNIKKVTFGSPRSLAQKTWLVRQEWVFPTLMQISLQNLKNKTFSASTWADFDVFVSGEQVWIFHGLGAEAKSTILASCCTHAKIQLVRQFLCGNTDVSSLEWTGKACSKVEPDFCCLKTSAAATARTKFTSKVQTVSQRKHLAWNYGRICTRGED